MPNITGNELLNAVVQDVKSFFPGRYEFELKFEYAGNDPKCRGVGKKCRIQMPIEFQDLDISDTAELNFWLFVLGHEIAHYLNRHNDFNALTEEALLQTQALEDWADFFGAKLMMTLVTYGEQVTQLYRSFIENKASARFTYMAEAFGKLANTYYANSSHKHSSRLVRIGSGVAGIMSFIDGDIGDVNVWRSVSIMREIYRSPALENIVMAEKMGLPKSVEPIVEIHQEIQGLAPAITEGLAPFLERFIGTSYSGSKEDRQKYVETMRQEALRQGLVVPPMS